MAARFSLRKWDCVISVRLTGTICRWSSARWNLPNLDQPDRHSSAHPKRQGLRGGAQVTGKISRHRALRRENRRFNAGEGGRAANYQDVMGQTLVKLCQKDNTIVGITAAMPSGTGLKHLEKAMPDRYYDVGIAEEHAVIFAAGMATMGFHPVVAIYSTFLQRAYDCIHHDVCLQDLPVTFCMDRAGLSANDGPTHHGLFDIAYLRCLPNVIAMAPKDEDELADMMFTATHQRHPTFIRYPRGAAEGVPIKDQPNCLKSARRRSSELFQQWQTQGRVVRPGPNECRRLQGGCTTRGGRV